MNVHLYSEILEQLKISVDKFVVDDTNLTDEIQEDIMEIINVVDISDWKSNIDGTVKTVSQLLVDLDSANKNNDRQRCIGTIAMLRCAISDIESAFSNSKDSMEKLIITIREDGE